MMSSVFELLTFMFFPRTLLLAGGLNDQSVLLYCLCLLYKGKYNNLRDNCQ